MQSIACVVVVNTRKDVQSKIMTIICRIVMWWTLCQYIWWYSSAQGGQILGYQVSDNLINTHRYGVNNILFIQF